MVFCRSEISVFQKNGRALCRTVIEKAECLALLWGSVVMVIAGGILTFENFFMRYLPKWALDLATAIHFYEAVLAVLVIIVWRFCLVIFNPEACPLNPTLWPGKVLEEEKAIVEPPKKDPLKEEKEVKNAWFFFRFPLCSASIFQVVLTRKFSRRAVFTTHHRNIYVPSGI